MSGSSFCLLKKRPFAPSDSVSLVLVFYTSPAYLVAFAAWVAMMVLMPRRLLLWRRSLRQQGKRLTAPHAALSLWMVLALLTLIEGIFVVFVDQSDALNLTTVSKRWFARHIEAERNAAGFRDRAEFEAKIPDGMKRIVFVGDSFTIGHGIRDMSNRFSDLVEVGLERRKPGKYLVANVADPGLEIAMIEARIKGLFFAGCRINMVVYVICLNDIEGFDPRTEDAIRQIQSSETSNPLVTQTYFLNWIYWRIVQLSNRGARDYFPHLKESYAGAPWNGFSAKLLQLQNDCRSRGAELRVVIFPFLTELGTNYPFHAAHQKITDFCQQNRIGCLDLESVLTLHGDEGLTVNRFDAHPNERAHALAAKAILDSLLSDQ